MRATIKQVVLASTAMTAMLAAAPAFAQSTGTQAAEEVSELVVTAQRGPKTQEGVIVQEREPKSRASITEEFISTQAPGQTVLDLINLLPGVNFTNNDPFGSAGGDLTLRGFDSQRIALLQDGVPLNDSGNYAIYPNQQLDSDLIERVTVNLGTTDVDSPTAAAAGGTINYITKRASEEMGGRFELGFGSDNFQRYYGTFETGAVGPWGTKAWVSGLYTKNDIFKPKYATIDPYGKIEKTQFNARIDQDLPDDRGFVSLIANYNENRNNFINRISSVAFNNRVIPVYQGLEVCTVRPDVQGPGAQTENCAGNFGGWQVNPSNTGNIRLLSSYKLTDTLTLTVDPSFQYTLANGGGAQVFPETDLQLRGASTAAGVDLNGDGDILDRVYLYRPNTTNTRRYGVTTSLLWRFAETQSVRFAYTYDRAKHRQTGDFGYLDNSGVPEDVFGGKDGYGNPVRLPDGTVARRRDRASIAELNQFAAEYRGRFLENRLLFNAGVRVPYFNRELANFCYQRDTFNAYCTTQRAFAIPGTNDGTGQPLVVFPGGATLGGTATGSQVLTGANLAAYRAFFNTTAVNSPFYGQPRRFERDYDKVLPNVGVSYDFDFGLTAYASYAETLSAPRTDDLYDQISVDPGPEVAKAYDIGLRYSRGPFLAAIAIFKNDFSNRIERVLDEPSGISFSQNIGDVELQGVDGQAGWEISEKLSVYASVSYLDSEIQNDIRSTSGTQIFRTGGKELYETPKIQGAARISWKPIQDLSFGLQGKFVGSRWTNLENTEKFPGYNLFDVDVRWRLDRFGLEGTYIQANVRNLLDKWYLGDIATNLSGTGLAQPGYPRTFTVTLHTEF